MAAKKENVNLTYDALWFKIFMDSLDIKFYGKEIFISSGLAGNQGVFMQLIGNIGGYARMVDFEKDIEVVVISDKMLSDFKSGIKDEFIQLVEDRINESNTAFRKLKFTTENLLLETLKTRANGRIKTNTKDLKDEKNTLELNALITQAIERDELMLSMIKRYRDSAKENITYNQDNLFV